MKQIDTKERQRIAATLTMTAPAWLLVPASWVGLLAGPTTGGAAWLLLPAVVIGWSLLSRETRVRLAPVYQP